MMKITTILTAAIGLLGSALAQGAPSPQANANAFATHSAPVCPGPAGVDAGRCHAWVVTDANGTPKVSAATAPDAGRGGSSASVPTGYGPTQLQTAYGVAGASPSPGTTVAIVDAFDDPNAEADLGTYSTQFGLPACTTSNGCFTKVNQTGGTRMPRANSGWALEISLDVQIVHAMCPGCKILLVEASSNSLTNLLAAEKYAASHANVVSNSWGAGESSSEASNDSAFSNVPITFSSGDSGYGVEWPAASPNVTAVGGTTLNLNSNNTRASETVWSGAGSGCSAYETQPNWQTNLNVGGCLKRIVADVAADADPNTGAAIYDSYGYNGQKGWFKVGGTSLASPLIASVYALAGNNNKRTTASSVYTLASPGANIYDVQSGSNGSCGGTYLCTGVFGYDGPTGLGTPIGTGAFQ